MTKKIVLTTPNGKYVWWPLLQVVDYVAKGKRNGFAKIYIPNKYSSNEDYVIYLACSYEARIRKSIVTERRLSNNIITR